MNHPTASSTSVDDEKSLSLPSPQVLSWEADERQAGMRARTNIFWVAYFILGLGIAVSIATHSAIRESVRNQARLKFEKQASDAHLKIEARIRSYVDIMYGLGALFRTSTNITRAQFHSFVTGLGLTERFPGFQAVNFAVHIEDRDKARFEETVRKDFSLVPTGYPNFQIKPPGKRDWYHVLSYMEPMMGNEQAMGRDLMAIEKRRSDAVENMRDTGELSSSGRLVVVNSTDKSIVGLAMRLPVYRDGAPLDTIHQRRNAFIGSIGAGFLVSKLLENVADTNAFESLRFQIFDAGPKSLFRSDLVYSESDRLLFDSRGSRESPSQDNSAEESTFRSTHKLEMAGRIVQTVFSAPESAMITPGDSRYPVIILIAGIGSSLLLFGMIYSLATSRARALTIAEAMTEDLAKNEKSLRNYANRLRAVSRRLVEVQEAERRTLSSELHDRIGQSLTAIGLNLGAVRGAPSIESDPEASERLEDAATLVRETIGSMRNLMTELRPQGLDEYGIASPLLNLATDFQKRTGIPVKVSGPGQELRFERTAELAMFRIAQEALNNIAKHSGATSVTIDFTEAGGAANMTIHDNGAGFDQAAMERDEKRDGYGLQIMRERAEAVGAQFLIESAQNTGTTIRVRYTL